MREELIKLGLSPNESLVFCALLESGETPSGEIIKKLANTGILFMRALIILKKEIWLRKR
ncbi:MAG: hypothetical protein PHQ42_00225 [Patescibacteria group bacterium]|nr:hypothetical protein [Patescibacteria group bacterium]